MARTRMRPMGVDQGRSRKIVLVIGSRESRRGGKSRRTKNEEDERSKKMKTEERCLGKRRRPIARVTKRYEWVT